MICLRAGNRKFYIQHTMNETNAYTEGKSSGISEKTNRMFDETENVAGRRAVVECGCAFHGRSFKKIYQEY